MTNNNYQTILKALNSAIEKPPDKFSPFTYLGTKGKYKNLSTATRRQLARNWLRDNKKLPFTKITKLLDTLYNSDSYDEKAVASYILQLHTKYRLAFDINLLNKWIENLNGWAEIDTLCQSTFCANEVLNKWKSWKALLTQFNNSSNISKRRASLVLLIKTVRESNDMRPAKLSFTHIEKLKNEQNILITKAISWLLRELTKQHWQKVRDYLDTNEDSLPKIVVRETEKKLTTGKK